MFLNFRLLCKEKKKQKSSENEVKLDICFELSRNQKINDDENDGKRIKIDYSGLEDADNEM